jgi:hypothetical protein
MKGSTGKWEMDFLKGGEIPATRLIGLWFFHSRCHGPDSCLHVARSEYGLSVSLMRSCVGSLVLDVVVLGGGMEPSL